MRYYYLAQSLMGSPTGTDTGATIRWQNVLDQVRGDAVRDGCPDPPPEMRATLRISDSSTVLSTRHLGRLIPALLEWSDRIEADAMDLDSYLTRDAYCLQHREEIAGATYTVQTVYTATGKDLRVDLAVENRTGHRLYGSIFGHGRMVGSTDPRQHRYGPRVGWGGSGDDEFGLRANTTVHFMLGDVIGEPFHVSSSGGLEDLRIMVLGGRCTVPAIPVI
jgi:hypothetical protein